jgi:hypothetical protein
MAVRAARERTFCRTREPAGMLEVLAWSPAVHEHHPEHPGTERPSASAGHASVRARHRLIRRGARPGQPRRPGPAMSDDLGPACAEVAALIPALSRDGTPRDRRTALPAGGAINPDILHAMIILAAEIPAACAAACEVDGEPWQHHPSAICLRAIPRLHRRLTALGMPAAASDLETGMHHWTRMVKRARPPHPRPPRRAGLPPRPVTPDRAGQRRMPELFIKASRASSRVRAGGSRRSSPVSRNSWRTFGRAQTT